MSNPRSLSVPSPLDSPTYGKEPLRTEYRIVYEIKSGINACNSISQLKLITEKQCKAAGCVWRKKTGNRRAVCATRVDKKTRLIDITNPAEVQKVDPNDKIIKVDIYPRANVHSS